MKLPLSIYRTIRLLYRPLNIIIFLIIFAFFSCTKLIQIDPPRASIVTSQVFGDSADALSAMEGVYTDIANSGFGYGFSYDVQTGASADELLFFASSMGSDADDQMYNNLQASADGNLMSSGYWTPSYRIIYKANAVMEGMVASKGVSQAQKAAYTGESLFFRAFCHFYLVNLFGPVPIIKTTDYTENAKAVRSEPADVYKSIISDLNTAIALLSSDYSAGKGERTRVNKWAAKALLARAYLFNQQWDSAAYQANDVINNTALFKLEDDLNNVFSRHSSEAILQWNLNTTLPPFNGLQEGIFLIPYDATSSPNAYINQQLFDAFEKGDKRKDNWIDSTEYASTVYYYPYKYKVGPVGRQPNADASEYYTVLRLAEQYLIRAEARAHMNDLSGAEDDIKVIRERAGLPELPSSLTQGEVLSAIMQERRVELFAEWGHRWLDLKRINTIDAVMTTATPLKNGGTSWRSYQQLYPIPVDELEKSPYLTQNKGY